MLATLHRNRPQERPVELARLRFFHNIPHPCMVDFFDELHRRQVNLEVFFQARHHGERPWCEVSLPQWQHRSLRGWRVHFGGRAIQVNYGLRELAETEPRDAIWVLSGFMEPAFQRLAACLNERGVPWVLLNEAPYAGVGRGHPRDLLRRLALRVCRSALGVIVFGAESHRRYYLERLRGKPVRAVPQLLDTAALHELARVRVRMRLERGRRVRVLYCGQWEKEKRVDRLFATALRLVQSYPAVSFVFAGTGSLGACFEQALKREATGRIVLRPRLTREALLQEYAEADVLVQPAPNQGWGMSVTEGLAAGLAVVSSRSVGAAEALVRPGVEGFLADPDDWASLEECLEALVRDIPTLNAVTEHAVGTGLTLSIAKGVDGFLEALEAILGRPVHTCG